MIGNFLPLQQQQQYQHRQHHKLKERRRRNGDGGSGFLWRLLKWRKRRQGFEVADDEPQESTEDSEEEYRIVLKASPSPTSLDTSQETANLTRESTPTRMEWVANSATSVSASATSSMDAPIISISASDLESSDDLMFTGKQLSSPLSTRPRRPRTPTAALPTIPSSDYGSPTIPPPPSPPPCLVLEAPPLPPPLPFVRNRTKDSFQGSLESMDSLVESFWDPDDDESLETSLVNNTSARHRLNHHHHHHHRHDFLSEHVSFLKDQTQPREVEVVYHRSSSPLLLSPTAAMI